MVRFFEATALHRMLMVRYRYGAVGAGVAWSRVRKTQRSLEAPSEPAVLLLCTKCRTGSGKLDSRE